jgi:hypothetical protein
VVSLRRRLIDAPDIETAVYDKAAQDPLAGRSSG